MLRIRVEGSGWAAAACCALLGRAGCRPPDPSPELPTVPFLTLNPATCTLLRDIFEVEWTGTEVRRRLVVQPSGTVREVSEPVLVVDAARSLRAAWQTLRSNGREKAAAGPIANRPAGYHPAPQWKQNHDPWTIYTQRRQGRWIGSGTRLAWTLEGEACARAAAEACVFEFTPAGWVFWFPVSRRKGILQFVLPAPPAAAPEVCRAMLDRTILGRAVRCGEILRAAVPCAAGLAARLTGERWLCCGRSAVRFDPVSGDGTGAALRSALLACSVVQAAANARDAAPYRDHYAGRLSLAFRKHLMACDRLYREGGLAEGWRRELGSIGRAIERTADLPSEESIRFRLRDYALAGLQAERSGRHAADEAVRL
jgi:hypothetical protein